MPRGSTKKRTALRRGSLPLLAAIFVPFFLLLIAAIAEVRSKQTPILIPDLNLNVQSTANASPFGAQIIGQQNGVNINLFNATEAERGITAPLGEHVVFTCPQTTTANLPVAVAHARPGESAAVRFWGYEYSGNEVANMRAGKVGRELWDGHFWLSTRENTDSNGDYAYLDTPGLTMLAGKRYYVMTDEVTGAGKQMRISCLDGDGDSLNNGAEDMNGNQVVDPGESNPNDADTDEDGILDGPEVLAGTNPAVIDTDADGIQDGTERGVTTVTSATNGTVFVADLDPTTTTNATVADTDGDTYIDGAEDLNHNGRIDPGESNPNDPSSIPVANVCGNGSLQGSEQCDDGNLTNGDGCSSACQMELGWQCVGEPSFCVYLLPDRGTGSSSASSMSSSVAANAVIYRIAPASGSQNINDQFTVDVFLDSPTQPIGGSKVVLTYSSNLTYVSYSATNSIMEVEVTAPSGTAGNLSFDRVTFGAPFTGTNGKILSLTFRRMATGNATINITQGTSEAVHATSFQNVLTGVSGATYSASTSAVLYKIVPASGAQNVNDQFTVDVLLDSPTQPIGGSKISLSYSPNLSYVSASATNSVMEVEVSPPTGSAGSLTFDRVTLGAPFTGTDGKILSLTFQRTATGNATISLAQAGSEAIHATSFQNVLSGVSGGTYSTS